VVAGTKIGGNVNRPEGGILIYTVASRTYEQITPSGGAAVWLPDGRRMLYIEGGRGLVLLDITTKVSTPVFSSAREELSGAGLSADTREIYLVITKRQSEIVLAKLTGDGK